MNHSNQQANKNLLHGELVSKQCLYDRDLHLEAWILTGKLPSFPLHFHDEFVIGLVANGTRILQTAQGRYSLQAGDLFLFLPGFLHGCDQQENETFQVHTLHIPVPVIEQYIQEVPELSAVSKESAFAGPVISNPDTSAIFSALFQQILLASAATEKKEMLFMLLMALCCDTPKKGDTKFDGCCLHSDINRSEAIKKACAFLETHCGQSLSLDDIAYALSMSRSSLIRLFVQELGCSPWKALEAIRIDRSRKLLASGHSLRETALLCGFYDQSHFTRCFVRQCGITPGLYLRMIQNRKT